MSPGFGLYVRTELPCLVVGLGARAGRGEHEHQAYPTGNACSFRTTAGNDTRPRAAGSKRLTPLDRCLLAGSKHPGRSREIPYRQASDMARGDDTSTPGYGSAHQAPRGLWTDTAVTADPVRRFGLGKPRRAPAGGTADGAGVTHQRVDAEY